VYWVPPLTSDKENIEPPLEENAEPRFEITQKNLPRVTWQTLMDFTSAAEFIAEYHKSSNKRPKLSIVAGALRQQTPGHVGRAFKAMEREFGNVQLFRRSSGDQLEMALTVEGERLASIFGLMSAFTAYHDSTPVERNGDSFVSAIEETKRYGLARLRKIPRSSAAGEDEPDGPKTLGLRRFKAPAKPMHKMMDEEAEAFVARKVAKKSSAQA